ncbi:protein kintoun [Drosophila gunungcola]|uniref:protein kintoun n=1 Tax=Drosophila gunungcola TaxID=103775 RepID=UPI0022E549FE|nr:protein kintoun [Drosophila gunungcola]XP_052841727.1 protein kintoun [Drosophila gunungcola]XP_052841728.1 protein kintoun [Drosophila gunungcola]
MSASATGPRNKHSKFRDDEQLDITKDEFNRFREALSQEEFRKLFFEYVEEIQDPENRKIYEEEIIQLEKERGVEVRFVHPKPGFVIKTALDGELKCFINIASSTEVERPKNELATDPSNGSRGLSWSIPMAQTTARDDCDARNNHCKVFDVVFHPDALHLAKRNKQFRKCLIDTALDAVEREFEVALDRANLKFPKLDYKGIARPTVIRKLAANPTGEEQEPHPLAHMFPTKLPSSEKVEPRVLPMKTKPAPVPEFSVPKYSIKHSHDVDLSEYTDELDAKLHVTVPRSLVVEIELPLLRSTAECQLDVTSKSVYLFSERQGAKYRLKLDLPFAVNDKAGSARFDTDLRRLTITLPVVRKGGREQAQMHETLRHFSREDSGVELHSNSESPVEEDPDGELSDSKADTSETATPTATPVRNANSPFLKSSVLYQLPSKFDCNVLDNVMAFVLHVPNVQPDSIEQLREQRSLHLQFATIGSGYYPTHYAFYVELPTEDEDSAIESVEAEAWDNNVVLKLCLSPQSEAPASYLAGLDAKDLKEYPVHGQYNVKSKRRVNTKKENASLDIKFEHNQEGQALKVTIRPVPDTKEEEQGVEQADQEHENEQQDHQQTQNKKPGKKQRKRNKKERSFSESACEDILVQEPQDGNPDPQAKAMSKPMPQRKQRSYSECNDSSGGSHRGILKRFSRYGPRPSMSDSCSSIDDCSSYSCSVDASGTSLFSHSFGGIPEEDRSDAGLSESCKKTVRFNDHIMKQVFRLDSSILGQRKKNQKRRDLKLRAQQRRLSEGDSVDYEETRGTALKQQENSSRKNSKPKGESLLHDSGLDLTGAAGVQSNIIESDVKNAMMFEMDDEDDVM